MAKTNILSVCRKIKLEIIDLSNKVGNFISGVFFVDGKVQNCCVLLGLRRYQMKTRNVPMMPEETLFSFQ